jgi:hypothetical protein
VLADDGSSITAPRSRPAASPRRGRRRRGRRPDDATTTRRPSDAGSRRARTSRGARAHHARRSSARRLTEDRRAKLSLASTGTWAPITTISRRVARLDPVAGPHRLRRRPADRVPSVPRSNQAPALTRRAWLRDQRIGEYDVHVRVRPIVSGVTRANAAGRPGAQIRSTVPGGSRRVQQRRRGGRRGAAAVRRQPAVTRTSPTPGDGRRHGRSFRELRRRARSRRRRRFSERWQASQLAASAPGDPDREPGGREQPPASTRRSSSMARLQLPDQGRPRGAEKAGRRPEEPFQSSSAARACIDRADLCAARPVTRRGTIGGAGGYLGPRGVESPTVYSRTRGWVHVTHAGALLPGA